LTAITQSGEKDEPGTRDFWYYLAVAKDACGNAALPSTMSSALNYHLGDVAPPGSGDNRVNVFDISRLNVCYFASLGPNDPCGDCDVAPVGPDGRPSTDNLVDFNDLIEFAVNFENVGFKGADAVPAATADGRPRLTLVYDAAEDPNRLVARLMLEHNAARVKGLHAVVKLGGATLLGVEQGELLNRQPLPVFLAHHPEDPLVIDAAILGSGATLDGNGEIARLSLATPGVVKVRLAEVDLRGVDGRPIDDLGTKIALRPSDAGKPSAESPAPVCYQLVGARPNPFNAATEIVFRLPRDTHVELRIYDVRGRLVRTLAQQVLPAGEHAVTWNGRDARNKTLSSGVYFYVIKAGEIDAVEKLVIFN
jgi:hypothetical protein